MNDEIKVNSYPILAMPLLKKFYDTRLLEVKSYPVMDLENLMGINENMSNDIKSGNFQSLWSSIRKFNEIYEKVQDPDITENKRHNAVVEDFINRFYKDMLKNFADEWVIYMSEISRLERDYEFAFGNFKDIKKKIDHTYEKEKLMNVIRLKALASNAIPSDVKYQDVVILDKPITSSVNTE